MKLIYLAIPYSGMKDSSYDQVNKAMIKFLEKGFNCFSPISHFHGLAKLGSPVDWNYWQKICEDWVQRCDEVIVLVPKEGTDKIRNSKGVQAEIQVAKTLGIPITFNDIEVLLNGD